MEYELFSEFVQNFLVERKDFLSGNDKIVLTPESIEEVFHLYVENPIEGSEQSFAEKLGIQFRNASEKAKIVFAHASWLYTLGTNGMTATGKISAVRMSLVGMPDYKLRTNIFLDKTGIANPGTGYGTMKYDNILFPLFIFKWIKGSQAGNDRSSILKAIINSCLYGIYENQSYLDKSFGPEKSRLIVSDCKILRAKSGNMRKLGIYNFLLNLCDRDYYQRIVSNDTKTQIAEKLYKDEYGAKEGLNTDDQLYLIKNHLMEEYPDLDPLDPFGDERIKPLWYFPKKDITYYWVFQGNPDIYDIVGALKELAVTKWRVASHDKEIKIGDKIILWVTGKEAGCYALGEVAGEVEYGVRDVEEKRFYKDNSYDVPHNRVPVRITHNLADNPILKEHIAGIKELAELKAGLQGTNFTATKDQYETFEKIFKGGGSRRYWLFSPGEEAKAWEDFYAKGIMGIGWHELGDLAQYKSRKEIESKLKEISETTKSKSNDSLANWEFKTVVSPGDIVIVKKGIQTLLGYGVVTSEYYFDPNQVEFKGCRKVQWLKKGEWTNTSSTKLHIKTLTDISKYDSNHPDRNFYYEELLDDMGVDLPLLIPDWRMPPEEPKAPIHSYQKHPLNLILFGPPGTGKTYNSINLAVEIADPEYIKSQAKQMSRIAITGRYKELVTEGRIVFTTFHQSISYEDFIEGIKPITNEDQENSLTYEVVPGIFKRLCDRAAMPDENNFEQAYIKLMAELDGYENQFMKLKTPTGREFGISLNSKNNLNLFTGQDFAIHAALNKDILISHILGKNTPEYFKGYYQGVLNHMKSQHGFDDRLRTSNNYVLIIDEINRGNVSQIFGEIITLIEPDKRAGMKEALEVTLPYSKDKFSVPPNLYIIGTMNTADRSVEALDTALRRRFSFLEMAPEYRLLDGRPADGIDLGYLLRTINDRIEGLLDKDHAIGHSYFLKVANGESTLKSVFFDEIIPLLQEYFYGNFGRIELVLGKGFVTSTLVTQSIFAKPSPDNDEFNDHMRYTLVRRDEMDDDAFQRALRVLMKESDEA